MPSVAKINNEVVNEEFYSPTNNTNFTNLFVGNLYLWAEL